MNGEIKPSIGAVIAAAGLSSRMKSFKPLKLLGDKPLIQHSIDTFRAAGITRILVVTGHQAKALESYLRQQEGISCIYNPAYQKEDMFESAKLGLKAIAAQCDRVFFTPGDIPLFSKETLKALISAEALLAKPVYAHKGGHPIIIDSSLISEICTYKGSQGLKGALSHCREAVTIARVEVNDLGILLDADTQEEFKKIEQYYKNSPIH